MRRQRAPRARKVGAHARAVELGNAAWSLTPFRVDSLDIAEEPSVTPMPPVKPIKEILSSPFELLLLFVGIADLIVLTATLLPGVWGPVAQLLHEFDLVACAVFSLDFVMRFTRAPSKKRLYAGVGSICSLAFPRLHCPSWESSCGCSVCSVLFASFARRGC